MKQYIQVNSQCSTFFASKIKTKGYKALFIKVVCLLQLKLKRVGNTKKVNRPTLSPANDRNFLFVKFMTNTRTVKIISVF